MVSQQQSIQGILADYTSDLRRHVALLRAAADRADESLRGILEDDDDDQALDEALLEAGESARGAGDVLRRIDGAYMGYAAACGEVRT